MRRLRQSPERIRAAIETNRSYVLASANAFFCVNENPRLSRGFKKGYAYE